MPLVQQDLITPPELTSILSGVRVARSLVLCVMFLDRYLYFFFSAIVLSILRFTDSDYPFGIFKLFRIRISVWNMKKHFNIVYFLFLLFVLFKHVPYIFSTLIRSRAS